MAQSNDEKVAAFRQHVEHHLSIIMEGTHPGMQCAFVLWRPGEPTRELVITSEGASTEEIVAVIRRRTAS